MNEQAYKAKKEFVDVWIDHNHSLAMRMRDEEKAVQYVETLSTCNDILNEYLVLLEKRFENER